MQRSCLAGGRIQQGSPRIFMLGCVQVGPGMEVVSRCRAWGPVCRCHTEIRYPELLVSEPFWSSCILVEAIIYSCIHLFFKAYPRQCHVWWTII